MKKMSLQVGIGLLLGIGALLLVAPQAQAGDPKCPKVLCGDRTSEFNCTTVDPNCTITKLGQETTDYFECLDCEGECKSGIRHRIKTTTANCYKNCTTIDENRVSHTTITKEAGYEKIVQTDLGEFCVLPLPPLILESVFTRFYIEKVDQDLEPVSSASTNDGA